MSETFNSSEAANFRFKEVGNTDTESLQTFDQDTGVDNDQEPATAVRDGVGEATDIATPAIEVPQPGEITPVMTSEEMDAEINKPEFVDEQPATEEASDNSGPDLENVPDYQKLTESPADVRARIDGMMNAALVGHGLETPLAA